MAIILPPRPGLGGILGQALGTGLSTGIEGALQAGEQKKGIQALKEGLNLSDKEAQVFRSLPPQSQAQFLKQRLQAPQRRQFASALSQMLGGKEAPTNIEELEPNQAAELAKLGTKREDIQERKNERRFKETADIRKEINKNARAEKDNLQRLNRMRTLTEKGDMRDPLLNSVLKRFNLDIDALKTPDQQEFEKLTQDFVKNARSVFGGRITNFELESFLKTIPRTENTKEGRLRIIENLELMGKGAKLRQEVMRDIIRENNDIPPFDLEDQIEERVGPMIDELAKEFSGGRADVVPVQKKPQKPEAEFSVGQTLDQLPKAEGLPEGFEVEDENTGRKFRIENGKWKRI